LVPEKYEMCVAYAVVTEITNVSELLKFVLFYFAG
jgi:hypothetical protein